MSSRVDTYSPPFVWPIASRETGETHGFPAWVNIPNPDLDVAATGVVWGLDCDGVRLVGEILERSFPRLRMKLLVAVYAASPTQSEVLRELLTLIERLQTRLEAGLMVLSLESNAAPMSALCFSEPASGRSYLWVGNSLNLGYGAWQSGHLNFGFECDAALLARWLDWFAGAWTESAPLTATTVDVPALVPAHGTEAAADSWRKYERFCRELGSAVIGADPGTADGEDPPREAEDLRQSAVAELCKEMGISPPDQLQERFARLVAGGQVVTIDHGSRTPPLELPLSKALRLGALGTETIVVTGEARLRVFTEGESKEIERLRRGVAGLIDRLTYPLADRVRWMPLAAKPLFERERAKLEKEAKERLGSLVGGNVVAFVQSRRAHIEREANEVYSRFHPKERLPAGTINLILRDLEDRLAKATGENFLPKVSYATQQFSTDIHSEHVAHWAPPRTMLAAIVQYARKALLETAHLRDHEIPEDALLQAMNVCDDHILRMPGSERARARHVAKRELRVLEEILNEESADRTKCEKIFELLDGSAQSLSTTSLLFL
jgi:hypothetical protein